MKKVYFSSLFFAAILTSLLVAGCQKDSKTLRIRMDSFEGPNGKVYMSGMAPAWSVGDTLMVNGEAATILRVSSGGATITVPTAASYAALYPYHSGDNTSQDAGGVWHFFLNSVQPYYEKDGKQVITAPMAAYTTGGTLTFHNLGALLCIQVNNNTSDVICVDAVTVESVGDYRRPLCGAATVEDYTSATAAYTIADNPEDWNTSVTLQKAAATSIPTPMATLAASSGTKAFYVHVPAVPANANNRFSITVTYHKQGETTSRTVTRTQASPTGGRIGRNQLANVGFDMFVVQIPEGAIDARFSVSSSKQVYFSKGNLQYQASNGIWRFADNQYDIIGNAAGNTTAAGSRPTQPDWIDLFGWATSGGGTPAFQPYLCSTENILYWSAGQNMTGDYAEYDWGWHNAISNGGNETHKWRTLTSAEWNYLLGLGSSNKRYVNGGTARHYCYDLVTLTSGTSSTSDDINGILIYPDGYTQQLAQTTTSIAAIPAGCAFLPAADQRTGTTVTIRGYCYYWTATRGSVNASDYNAKCLTMTSLEDDLQSPVTQGRQVGSSVRLVQNCNQQ